MMAERKEQVVGAWYESREEVLRGKTGLQIVWRDGFGVAHAGDLRKPWRVPDEMRPMASPSISVVYPAPTPKRHPLLSCDDKELAEAFERLAKEPAFTKIPLTDWEFKLAADAPTVFLKWGQFTWKQRKYLRQIVKKIMGGE